MSVSGRVDELAVCEETLSVNHHVGQLSSDSLFTHNMGLKGLLLNILL